MLTTEQTSIEQGIWSVSREVYHSDRQCLCNSALGDFRKSVPLFHGRHIAGTIPPREASEAMNLGTAVHLAILEPERFADSVIAAPTGINRRTNDGKEEYAAFLARAEGKIVLDADDMTKCKAMADAVHAHEHAHFAIAKEGLIEQAIRWRDEESGLWVRNLMDKVIPEISLVIDLKTSIDPTPASFSKSVANFGYHTQAALYSRGAQAVFGLPVDFLFVVVGSEPPHEVCCYLLDQEALNLGDRLNMTAMNEIAERIKTNSWRSRYADRIQTINLPRWEFTKENS